MVNANSFKVRRAYPGDQAFINDMNIAATFGAIETEDKFPNTDEFLAERPDVAELSVNFGRKGDVGLIAEDEQGNLVGAVWGREYDRKPDSPLQNYAFEITIAVKERARRQGLGRKLLDLMTLTALAEGRREVCLGVHEKSPARSLYERAGFVPLRADNGTEARVDNDFVPMVKKI